MIVVATIALITYCVFPMTCAMLHSRRRSVTDAATEISAVIVSDSSGTQLGSVIKYIVAIGAEVDSEAFTD